MSTKTRPGQAVTALSSFALMFMLSGVGGSFAQPVSDGATAPAEAGASSVQASPTRAAVSRPYYIEFRSRSAQSYGHTFSIYGKLNGGRIASKTVAGLHPASESVLPWMVGHLVLVPSETGASDGDTEDQYVTARFRMNLSADEYKRVIGYVKGLQAKSPIWHAVLYNCNAFVGDIAKFMGLETPASTMLMPASYINGIADLNRSKSGPGIIGVPAKVEDAERLRAAAMKSPERLKQRSRSAAAVAPASN